MILLMGIHMNIFTGDVNENPPPDEMGLKEHSSVLSHFSFTTCSCSLLNSHFPFVFRMVDSLYVIQASL